MLGPSSSRYVYALASRSVDVISSSADFGVGYVYGGSVGSNGYDFGFGYSSGFYDNGGSFSLAVRPVAILSSDFQVVDQNGTWQLAE